MTQFAPSNQPDNYIHIALAVDAHYAPAVEVFLKSLLLTHRSVHVYILHKHVFPEMWFTQMNVHLSQMDSAIHSIIVDNDVFQNHHPTNNKLPESSFYRFFIPWFVPAERVLYLDVDTLILGSLHDFFHRDFNGKHLIAIEDMVLSNQALHYRAFPDLKPYFNSGVLLFHSQLWREERFFDELQQVISENKHTPFGDQDILNLALQGKWQKAEIAYNYQIHTTDYFHERNAPHLFNGYCPEIKILHFTGARKPWRERCRYSEIYDFIAQKSWESIIAMPQQIQMSFALEIA